MFSSSRLGSFALLAASAVCLLACAERVFIRPAEIPKLSGSFTQATPLGPNNTLVRYSIARVAREDGSLVDLNGNLDLVLVLRDGQEHVFEHPLGIVDVGSGYDIQSGNRAAAHVEKADIVSAAVDRR